VIIFKNKCKNNNPAIVSEENPIDQSGFQKEYRTK